MQKQSAFHKFSGKAVTDQQERTYVSTWAPLEPTALAQDAAWEGKFSVFHAAFTRVQVKMMTVCYKGFVKKMLPLLIHMSIAKKKSALGLLHSQSSCPQTKWKA